MGFGDPSSNGSAQARATAVGLFRPGSGLICPVKPFENPLQRIRRDAGSIVGHPAFDSPILHASAAETDVASLAAALERVLANPEAARAMGERGRRRVLADYGVERIRALLNAVWDSLMTPASERFAR